MPGVQPEVRTRGTGWRNPQKTNARSPQTTRRKAVLDHYPPVSIILRRDGRARRSVLDGALPVNRRGGRGTYSGALEGNEARCMLAFCLKAGPPLENKNYLVVRLHSLSTA
eukprot:SAG31_NODE_7931_length_1561_cov_1.906293_1_plen_110_part_10